MFRRAMGIMLNLVETTGSPTISSARLQNGRVVADRGISSV